MNQISEEKEIVGIGYQIIYDSQLYFFGIGDETQIDDINDFRRDLIYVANKFCKTEKDIFDLIEQKFN